MTEPVAKAPAESEVLHLALVVSLLGLSAQGHGGTDREERHAGYRLDGEVYRLRVCEPVRDGFDAEG